MLWLVVCYAKAFLVSRLRAEQQMATEFKACWGLMDFTWVLDQSGVWLSEGGRARAVSSAQLFMDAFMALARAAHVRSRPLYLYRPKHHAFACKVVRRMRNGSRFNPNCVSCWGDEDLVGRQCTASRGCHPRSALNSSVAHCRNLT